MFAYVSGCRNYPPVEITNHCSIIEFHLIGNNHFGTLQRYSQSRRSAFCWQLEQPQRPIPAAGPIDSFRNGMVERWNSTRQNHGMVGNHEAVLFTKSLASRLPSFAWYYSTIPLKSVPLGCEWEPPVGTASRDHSVWQQIVQQLCE